MTPRDYAILAQRAYGAAPSIGSSDGAARLVKNDTALGLVLAIPGTDNLACIEADADVLVLDAGVYGGVHRGIWNAFAAVHEAVQQAAPVTLCGHSEGAAGAIYLAARLCMAGKPPKAVHAFEPPRTSVDGALAGILREHKVDLHIYHHGRDVVPMVPVPIPGQDWQHAGSVLQFGKASAIWPNFADHDIAAIILDL
ncbi:MAG: lipase [Burkholderiaceae bacterium]|nr:lipase [Burkholderiaceae bacterium]